MIWAVVQNDSDQAQVFSGSSLPDDLLDLIETSISKLTVIRFWNRLFIYVCERPFSRCTKKLTLQETSLFLHRQIESDATVARTDDGDGCVVDFKLAMNLDPDILCQFLTSFRHPDAPPKSGWMQRAFTVIRTANDKYMVFHPPLD